MKKTWETFTQNTVNISASFLLLFPSQVRPWNTCITWTHTATSTHFIDGWPCSTATVAATGCCTRSTLTMALQERLRLRGVKQSIDCGKLIGNWTGDVVFRRHHRGRTRSSMNKRTWGKVLWVRLLLLYEETKVKKNEKICNQGCNTNMCRGNTWARLHLTLTVWFTCLIIWYARWNVSKIQWISVTYPSGKKPSESVWKRGAKLGKWPVKLSGYRNQVDHSDLLLQAWA